jgi:hypothetical protein
MKGTIMRRPAVLLILLSALALGATGAATVALGNDEHSAEAARPRSAQRMPGEFRARLPKALAAKPSPARAQTQAQVLAAVLQGMPAGDIADAHVGEPPAGFVPAPSLGEVGTAWVYVTVRAPDHTDGNVVAEWESNLIGGAIREANHALKLPDVLGQTTTIVYPDATSFGPNSQVNAQPFARATLARTVALDRIRTRLAQRPEFARVSLSVLEPYGVAVLATVWLDGNSTLGARRSAALEAFGDLDDYEGTLVRVLDSSGSVVRIAAYSARTGVGSGWSRPGEPSDGLNLAVETS